MRELPLNALRAYAFVYRWGGVRPAARQLGVTHSTVSRHVGELEAWIGAPLIADGPGRRISFTAAGRQLGGAALKSLQELDGAVSNIREAKGPNAVVIATTPSVAIRWLLPLLAKVARDLPRVEISVLTETALMDPDGSMVDFAIRMGAGAWRNVKSIPLMDDALYPAAHPDFIAAIAPSTDEKVLARGPLLHDRDPVGTWGRWFERFPDERVNIRRGPRFASSDLQLRAASEKLGVALARDRLAAPDIAAGALKRLCAPHQIDLGPAYWIVLPASAPPVRKAVSRTVDWLLAHAT